MIPFQKVTAPKTDFRLVKTVGALVNVIGTALILAAAQQILEHVRRTDHHLLIE